MRKYVTIALCALAVIACEQKKNASTAPADSTTTRTQPGDARNAKLNTVIPQEPQFVDHALIGSEVGKDGAVTRETSSFSQGQPIFFTLVIRESPVGLQTGVEWQGPGNKPMRTERKDMKGAKVATFRFNEPKAKPGRYHVVGYWGGNIAAEKDFDIIAPAKTKRKKG